MNICVAGNQAKTTLAWEKDILKAIKEDFEKTRADNHYSQEQKNRKYASLMSRMEWTFNIPLLADERFEALDEDIKSLYLALSYAREW